MKTIGFPISKKENEKRRALVPDNLKNIKNTNMLYFQEGYGEVLGYDDTEYEALGAHIVSESEVFDADIICDPKIGDADYISLLKNKTLFGWIHAVQNKDITDAILNGENTAYAWEDMFEDGRHIFWRNNELAGEAAIMHAFQCYGIMPYNCKVAVLGRGNIANGAIKVLTQLGADVRIYNKKTEDLFRKEICNFDVIVNGILWDTKRKDHIIYEDDLNRMKKGALVIDISCDRAGGIETSIPTTIEEPTYVKNGIIHYVVDHTPSLFFKTASKEISRAVEPFIDELCEGKVSMILNDAKCIENGVILDQRINEFQKR